MTNVTLFRRVRLVFCEADILLVNVRPMDGDIVGIRWKLVGRVNKNIHWLTLYLTVDETTLGCNKDVTGVTFLCN